MDRFADYLIDVFLEYQDTWSRPKPGSLRGIYMNQRGMAAHQLRRGEDFVPNDTYKRLRKLEPGHEGVCELLKSKTNGRLLVVKYVKSSKHSVPNEVRILLDRLRPHPNIINIFTMQRSARGYGRCAIYMEYCNVGDLLEQLIKFEKLGISPPVVFTLHVFVSLACALAYIHHGIWCEKDPTHHESRQHRPIVHRDIKPDNVFLRLRPGNENGLPDVVLGDFGFAQLECDSRGIAGTPAYESPEARAVSEIEDNSAFRRANNTKIMTTKSDVYGLDVIVHLLATENYWKCAADPQTIKLPRRYTWSQNVSEKREQIVGFVAALVWCLQVDPVQRPECTYHRENGLLHAIDKLKEQRDSIVDRYGPVDDWV